MIALQEIFYFVLWRRFGVSARNNVVAQGRIEVVVMVHRFFSG
jgi:hypothetical protein